MGKNKKYKMLQSLGLHKPAEKVSVWKAMGRDEEFEKVAEKYPDYPGKFLLKTDIPYFSLSSRDHIYPLALVMGLFVL